MADNQPVVEVTEDIEEIEVGDGADPTYQLDPGAYCVVTNALSAYMGRGRQNLSLRRRSVV